MTLVSQLEREKQQEHDSREKFIVELGARLSVGWSTQDREDNKGYGDEKQYPAGGR